MSFMPDFGFITQAVAAMGPSGIRGCCRVRQMSGVACGQIYDLALALKIRT
jgi:hypothetical protein